MIKRLQLILLSLCTLGTAFSQTYQADWNSCKNYEAPEWYEDAKIGFWVHWGVYSVPAFKGDHASEWYGRWMYYQKGQEKKSDRGLATHTHHVATYGDPAKFGYKDFIPMFKAEKFNPEEWADLFVEGGARFFTMMAMHHDSFCLWNAKSTPWNSVNMGPKRDLVGDIGQAVQKRGLKFGVSNHSAWNYTFFEYNHRNGYDAKDPANQDLYGNPVINGDKFSPSKRDIDRWLERTLELCDSYQPDLYYFDWDNKPTYFDDGNRTFVSHYYNQAIKWGKGTFGKPGVVVNYKKDIFPEGTAVHDIERGRMSSIADRVWQTDDCIYDGSTWGYTEGEPIKPTVRIVHELMDIISKRGVLMLSLAPKADGTFPEDQKAFIRQLGSWLQICGEAVYGTRPYHQFSDEPPSTGSVKTKKTTEGGTRYTRSKDNTILYATSLGWPGPSYQLRALAGVDPKSIKSVRLIGVPGELKWNATPAGLEVIMPEKPSYDYAYPVRIEFTQTLEKPRAPAAK